MILQEKHNRNDIYDCLFVRCCEISKKEGEQKAFHQNICLDEDIEFITRIT